MTTVFNRIQIRRPIEEVFDFVTTPAYWPRWHPASVSVGGNADHSLLLGEQVSERFSVAGYRGLATWRVRERSAPWRWVIVGAGEKGGGATIIYALIENPNGTSFQRELVYSVPNKLLQVLNGLFLRRRMRADSAEALRRLKRLLEYGLDPD